MTGDADGTAAVQAQLAHLRDVETELRTRLVEVAKEARLLYWESASADPNNVLYAATDGPHWHVQRHGEDDDILSAWSVVTALDYAEDALERIAEHENDGVAACADAKDYQAAYECGSRARQWWNLSETAGNLHTQATVVPWEREALYSTPNERRNLDRLRCAIDDVLMEINADAPPGFVIGECRRSECAPKADDED